MNVVVEKKLQKDMYEKEILDLTLNEVENKEGLEIVDAGDYWEVKGTDEQFMTLIDYYIYVYNENR